MLLEVQWENCYTTWIYNFVAFSAGASRKAASIYIFQVVRRTVNVLVFTSF